MRKYILPAWHTIEPPHGLLKCSQCWAAAATATRLGSMRMRLPCIIICRIFILCRIAAYIDDGTAGEEEEVEGGRSIEGRQYLFISACNYTTCTGTKCTEEECMGRVRKELAISPGHCFILNPQCVCRRRWVLRGGGGTVVASSLPCSYWSICYCTARWVT